MSWETRKIKKVVYECEACGHETNTDNNFCDYCERFFNEEITEEKYLNEIDEDDEDDE